jgi:CRISPR/Cas system-associated exonuclease Cas4 (RecB family)
MKYECIKPFPPMGTEIGEIYDIEKQCDNTYVIEETGTVEGDVLYEFFKKKMIDGWKYAPYSHSRMESWVGCPKKFEYQYIIKPPRKSVPNPILEKGTLFHGILEFDMVDKLEEFDLPDKFKALSKEDAEKIIGQALNFSETSEIYIWIKDLPGGKVPEQEMFLGPKMEPVEDISEALIRGFIDLLIFDSETKSCYIFDWKTGGKSKEALKKWPKPKDQLELYAIWANQVFGATYIESAFVYVEHNHMAKYVFEEKDIPALKKKFLNKINNIEIDKQFNKNLTQLCAWCDFKELCLGLPADKNPRDITKDEIMAAGRGKPKENRKSHKNTAFLNKIRSKSKVKA